MQWKTNYDLDSLVHLSKQFGNFCINKQNQLFGYFICFYVFMGISYKNKVKYNNVYSVF